MPSIQIQDVPQKLHARLEARAAAEGKSLSDYLLAELHQIAGVDQTDGRPALAEWFERLQSRAPLDLGVSTAEAIRELRGPLPRTT